MKRLLTVLTLVLVLVIALPAGVALGQQTPAPIPVLEKRFQATAPSVPYDMVLLVLDLAPGAETPTHRHGGPVFVTVLEGALWEQSGGRETILNTGDTLTEEPGRVHTARNSGSVNTRLVVTVLLPRGAALTTLQETGATANLPPGPTVVAQASLESPQAPSPLDIVQRVTDLPAGATIALHTHPGPNFNILLQGGITLNMEGTSTPFGAGDSWVEPANVVHGGSNTGAGTARTIGSALVPRGAPVATPAQQPTAAPAAPAPAAAAQPTAPARPAAPAQVPTALPRTGELPILPGALAGLGLLAVGLLVRRPHR